MNLTVRNNRSFGWPLIAALFVVTLCVLAGAAIWLERSEAIDAAAGAYEWGGSRGSSPPPDDMVLVPGGQYIIGDDSQSPSEDAPLRRVRLDAFYIDRHEVTNREFARFVDATGYVTTAEREGGAWVYRGGERDWIYVTGADWRHPLGRGSSIDNAAEHPVVLVSWEDAAAYARWAGKRLPTEAEWEVAARGGIGASPLDGFIAQASIDEAAHAEHNDSESDDESLAPHPSAGAHSRAVLSGANPAKDGSANVWQGRWPQRNELTDRFFYTAPVGSFAPNRLGIYDMIGNAWEWTEDWYAPVGIGAAEAEHNPSGPETGTSRVARGGSWFCSDNYCGAYRPGFRGKSPPASAFNNVGFRCARDVVKQP